MTHTGLLLLAAAMVAYGLFAPIRRALVMATAVWVLIPATLIIPNDFTSYLNFGFVAELALAGNLVLRTTRGELSPGLFHPTKVHAAFVAFVALYLIVGVGLAIPAVPFAGAFETWFGVFDQFLFFIIVLACARAIDDLRWLITAVAGVLLGSAVIGIAERLTGQSWGHWLFLGSPFQTDASKVLVVRAGSYRVRAGAEFALQYGWVTGVLFPPLLAATLTARRHPVIKSLVLGGPVLLAIYFSFARSALIAVLAGVVVVWVASRLDRRAGALMLLATATVVGVLVFTPRVEKHFNSNVDQGSVDVREVRLPIILGLTAPRPLEGLGANGLDTQNLPTTDAAYLRTYAEVGVPGLTLLVLLLVVGAAAAGQGLRASGDDRLIAGAAFAGIVVALISGFAYDSFSLGGSTRPFWLLVAVGVAIGESARPAGPVLYRVSRPRLAIALSGVAVGGLLLAVAPTHVALTYGASTVPVFEEDLSALPTSYVANALGANACELGKSEARLLHLAYRCAVNQDQTGAMEYRVQAPTREQAEAAEASINQVIRRGVPGFDGGLVSEIEGRPTVFGTAPVWLGLVGLAAALFLPPLGGSDLWAATTGLEEDEDDGQAEDQPLGERVAV
jgi:hypothetical protein